MSELEQAVQETSPSMTEQASAPPPTDRPPPIASPGEGERDLAAAFGEPPSSSEETSGEQPSDQPDGDGDAAQATPPPSPPVDPSRSLDDVIQQRVQAEINARQAAAQQQQWNQRLQAMSDAEFGAYSRQYQQQMAQFQTVQESVASRFYVEATQDVIEKVPELQKLTPQQSQNLDPKKYQTYGDMVSAWVDTVADVRSKGAAEKSAKTMFAAWKAEEVARLAKEFPTAPAFGNGAGQYGDNEPRFDTASGEELLAFGLAHKK